MMIREELRFAADLANRLASDVAEFAIPQHEEDNKSADSPAAGTPLSSEDQLLSEYDQRITDEDLRTATRTRFVAKHYADAVESGVKALNDCVRRRCGSNEDGDALMTLAFSPNKPILRVSRGKSKSDDSVQRGHMNLCQGVIGAWRNPRAHTLIDDAPNRALMMLETINDLIIVTKSAIRTRKPRKP